MTSRCVCLHTLKIYDCTHLLFVLISDTYGIVPISAFLPWVPAQFFSSSLSSSQTPYVWSSCTQKRSLPDRMTFPCVRVRNYRWNVLVVVLLTLRMCVRFSLAQVTSPVSRLTAACPLPCGNLTTTFCLLWSKATTAGFYFLFTLVWAVWWECFKKACVCIKCAAL